MAKDTVTRYEELDRPYTKGLKLRRIFVDRKGTDLAAWLRARGRASWRASASSTS